MDAYRFWVKVFALSFALGVVSGITMSFQFGTNWPGFMETRRQYRRPVAGLRGADRVFPGGRVPRHHAVRLLAGAGLVHTTATFLVAFGTTMRRSGSSC